MERKIAEELLIKLRNLFFTKCQTKNEMLIYKQREIEDLPEVCSAEPFLTYTFNRQFK